MTIETLVAIGVALALFTLWQLVMARFERQRLRALRDWEAEDRTVPESPESMRELVARYRR